MEWWKKLSYWKKGACMGIIFGLTLYFLSFIFDTSSFSYLFWSLSILPFCSILKLGTGENCGLNYLFFGWVFMILVYGVLFSLFAIIIKKIGKKWLSFQK